MTQKKRERFAYWFFLIFGASGNLILLYWFATKQMDYSWWKILIALSVFSTCMFKPTLFVDTYNLIVKKQTNNDGK